jgi:ligand-binding sensor domain-containing protein/two-component sensor histidine kinase
MVNRFITFFFSVFAAACLAQQPVFFNITTEENLPSNDIYSIAKDSLGFIWLGTDAGLFRYNGVKFTQYLCPTQKSKAATGLVFSEDGKLFFHNFSNQIFYLENGVVTEIEHHFNKVLSFFPEKEVLWVNHKEGISQYNFTAKAWKDYYIGPTKAALRINDETINFIVEDGLCALDSDGVVTKSENKVNYIPIGTAALILFNDTVWMLESLAPKILKWKNGRYTEESNPTLIKALAGKKLTGFYLLEDGCFWFTSYSGIIRYNPLNQSVNVFYEDYAFSSCMMDNEGNYWFTTLKNGIFIVPNIDFLLFNAQSAKSKVLRIHHQHPNLFYTTDNGYIGKFDMETEKLKMYDTGLRGDIAATFFDREQNAFYFNMNDKMYKLQNEKIDLLHSQSPPLKHIAKSFGYYFLASSFECSYTKNIEQIEHTEILHVWSRKVIINEQDSLIYIATNDGLYVYRFSNNEPVLEFNLFKNQQIKALESNADKSKMYAVVFDGSVYEIEGSKAQKIIALDSDVLLNHLLFDNNRLIFSTNNGLEIYHLKEKSWVKINKLNGLSSTDIRWSTVVDSSIWLATSNGLQKIPSNFSDKKPLASIFLTQVMVGENQFEGYENIKLNYNEAISFEPEVIHFASMGRFQYAYRIANRNSDWVLLPAQTDQIVIPKLPSGNFKVELKAIDYIGRDSENTIIISGFVAPPFWQKWWFVLLCFVAVIAIGVLIFRQRIKVLRQKQKEELEKIKLQNQLNISQQTALKAQMNPHFIFNVLNSITGYIYENDRKSATTYLADFSDLVRRILDMSSGFYVSLSQELEALELYIKLEAMLLSGDFSYRIETDQNIDLDFVRIPSLIIQPFVENAFKHGLRHKKGEKTLLIEIVKSRQDVLQVVITDNGVGRKASAEINAASSSGHKSFATDASAKRIELLNKEQHGMVSVEIIDLYSHNNQAAGTKVILNISVENDEV